MNTDPVGDVKFVTCLTQNWYFFSDPDDVAERVKFKATVGNLLEKYGLPDKDKDTQIEPAPEKPTPTPKDSHPGHAGRKAMTKDLKEQVKGGAALQRSRRGR